MRIVAGSHRGRRLEAPADERIRPTSDRIRESLFNILEHRLGGFAGKAQQEEDSRIIAESVRRYPVMNLKAAVKDSLAQFADFKTGDGIEPQLTILEAGFKHLIPSQVPL